MSSLIDYAPPLRAIGQALEILKIENFQLEPDGDDFIVRGAARGGADAGSSASRSIRFSWGQVRDRKTSATELEAAPAPAVENQLELCYTLKDVHRLDVKGLERRGETRGGAEMPRLAEMLRTVGAHLDEKAARLVKISKHGESIIVDYETYSGVRFEVKLAVADVHEMQAAVSMKRGKREFH